jgi:enterochelin esterase-like enzyme
MILILVRMRNKQIVKPLLILLFMINHFSVYSQQDFFTTEFNEGKAIINTVVPHANTVKILGAGGSWGFYNLNLNFTKSGDSVWKVILDPNEISYITPGFHYYDFQVNGISTLNPNERAYINTGCTSGIEIPDSDIDFYDIKDVPHGTIRMQFYYSTLTKKYRKCFIYLPPAYDTKSAEKYPVLFLQHGMNETQYSWHMQGKMNFILDNLIADGKALPMIVVMENGMTAVNYSTLVINDLMPLLIENYKVKTGKLNTAVAGLSMGSYQATDLGLANSDKFGYVAAFCGGTDLNLSTIRNDVNSSIIALYNGYGITDELNLGQSFETNLNKFKVNHINAKFPGGHEWQVWRKCLYQFAQLLFKPYTYENDFSGIANKTQSSFSVFPIPFNGQIHLQFNNPDGVTDAQYQLHDISGKQILSYKGELSNAENIISEALNATSSGMLILSVYSKSNVNRVKIIK